MDLLDEFVARHTALEWSPAYLNCALVLADWVMANGRSDPALPWRGSLSEADARLMVAQAGGLAPIVDDLAHRAGLSKLSLPVRGAVGVIGATRNAERQWGAIHDGRLWLVRLRDGFGPLSAKPLTIWGL